MAVSDHEDASGPEVEIRQARPEDTEAVVAFTRDTWSDREGASDYMPETFPRWVETDGPTQRTFVADVDDGADVAGVLQGVLLSETEAWAQGMRVNPDYRGEGLSPRLSRAVFRWARGQGATVVRNMVFSWNVAGLGQSRSVGFEPATEFRWAMPEPDADADPALPVTADPAAAWSFWSDGAARSHLGGLALDFEESWSMSELRRENLRRAADDDRLLVVQSEGTRAFTVRSEVSERDGEDGETTTQAVYAVGAWDSTTAADALFDAVARDAAGAGADVVRVLIPEGVRWVSDAAAVRCGVSDEPDFAMRADLTDPAVLGED